ncbi:UDP-Glycosyltransferase/glycogen phosphorylase [Lentinula raphanica]|nr:UDP-Glycosyltransferase/glycogen phosphorylase [Lentinula raphanica]
MTVLKHIVAHNVAAWGAYKPLSAFAVLVTESRKDVVFTVLITGGMMYQKFMQELAKLSVSQLEEIRSRINVVDLTGQDVNPLIPLAEFRPAFEAIYSSKPITCKATGTVLQGLSPPTVALIDPFVGYAVEAIRDIAGSKCSILSWMTAPAGATLRLVGPEEYGGVGDLSPKVEAEVALTGKSYAEVATELYANFTSGEIINVPGIPAMYDYEWVPQEVNLADHSFYVISQKYIRLTDGMLCVSSSGYEPEAMDAARKWMDSMGKAWYPVGPLSLRESPEHHTTEARNPKDLEVISFLDKMHDMFGKKSVFFISFGTVFWPAQPEKLWLIIDELIALGKPFILAHTSILAHVPDERKKLIKDSGIGLEMAWSPQERILSHPATGWFITHGGWNSTQEALAHRVPVIYWPFSADQPYNAARTIQHNAGFELIEVRTGKYGTQVPYRFKDSSILDRPTFSISAAQREFRELLQRIEGEEGRVVRANFERLAKMMDETWDEGYEAQESLRAFFREFLDVV